MGRRVAQRISQRIVRAGYSVDIRLAQELESYIGLLTKWNRRINLTALSLDPLSDQAVDRLVVEPIGARRYVLPTDRLVVDVGSGGGSPAIPFKLASPQLRLVMVEAKTRKSAFLREAIRELHLDGDEVSNSSLEELLSRPDLLETADLVTIRAVRADDRLWSTVAGLMRPGARVFWFGSLDASSHAGPLLAVEAREPLVPSLRSALTILRKPSELRS
jgi:16S rRNA (guanine(527)-N(7))-methyltransferase RsmG